MMTVQKESTARRISILHTKRGTKFNPARALQTVTGKADLENTMIDVRPKSALGFNRRYKFVQPREKKVFNIKYPQDAKFEAGNGSQRAEELKLISQKRAQEQALQTSKTTAEVLPSRTLQALDFKGLDLSKISKLVGAHLVVTKTWEANPDNDIIRTSEFFAADLSEISLESASKSVTYKKSDKENVDWREATTIKSSEIPETPASNGPFRFSLTRNLRYAQDARRGRLLKPHQVLPQLNNILQDGGKSDAQKLYEIFAKIDQNEEVREIFGDLVSKYREGLTSAYALYCLRQEFDLVKMQIESYKSTLSSSFEAEELAKKMDSGNRRETVSLVNSFTSELSNFEYRQKEDLKDFWQELRAVLNDVNVVERFQTEKPFERLVFAEKFPAIQKFKSKILDERELRELLGDQRLSGQQVKLLVQIEDIIANPQARAKVRGLLDTGMGKTFLAEKVAQYSEILAMRPKNDDRVSSFEIININLANQEELKELEETADSLAGKLIIIDEDFFIPDQDKNLRALVDKGAKIIRFGASENLIKLIEDFYRAEEKNSDGKEIAANNQRIAVLQALSDKNKSQIELYQLLKESYSRHSDNRESFSSFDSSKFKEVIQGFQADGLIRDLKEGELEKIEASNFTGRSNRADRSNIDIEIAIAQVIDGIRDLPAITLSENLHRIKSLSSSLKPDTEAIKDVYDSLKTLSVFDQDVAKKLQAIFESSYPESCEKFNVAAKDFLPVFEFAAAKALLLQGIDPNLVADSTLGLEERNIGYLRSVQETITVELAKLEARNAELEINNQVFAAKQDIRKSDVRDIKTRRDLTKDRIEQSQIKIAQGQADWSDLVLDNLDQESAKSQNLFPGIALSDDEETKSKLLKILQQSGKEIVVANIVEDGQHRCLIAKDGVVTKCDFDSGEFDELTEGVTQAVMIYAGARLEFVVGGDYKHLSILRAGDQQNVFLPKEEIEEGVNPHYDIDRFKQYFGRDRGDGINIKRQVIVQEGIDSRALAAVSYRNSQENDLEGKLESLESKIGKYFTSEEEYDSVIGQVLNLAAYDPANKAESMKHLEKLALLVFDREELEKDFFRDEVADANREKYYRDIKAFAFYSLIDAVNENDLDITEIFQSFQSLAKKKDLDLDKLEIPQSLNRYLKPATQEFEIAPAKVDVLNEIEELSQLLHLKEKLEPQVDLSSLNDLKRASQDVLSKVDPENQRRPKKEIEITPEMKLARNVMRLLKAISANDTALEALKEKLTLNSDEDGLIQSFSLSRTKGKSSEYGFELDAEGNVEAIFVNNLGPTGQIRKDHLDKTNLQNLVKDIRVLVAPLLKKTTLTRQKGGEFQPLYDSDSEDLEFETTQESALEDSSERDKIAAQKALRDFEASDEGKEFFDRINDKKSNLDSFSSSFRKDEDGKIIGFSDEITDINQARELMAKIDEKIKIQEDLDAKAFDLQRQTIEEDMNSLSRQSSESEFQEQRQQTKEMLEDFLKRRISEINSNDGINYKGQLNPEKKLLNTNKVVRVLTKINQALMFFPKDESDQNWSQNKVKEMIGAKDNDSGPNKSLPKGLILSVGDKSVLAMMCLRDEDRKEVFGNLNNPRFNPHKLSEDFVNKIAEASVKLSQALKGNNLKDFEFSKSKDLLPSRLSSGSKNLTLDLPSFSVESPKAFKLSLILHKSRSAGS